jgi:hypothetical protein
MPSSVRKLWRALEETDKKTKVIAAEAAGKNQKGKKKK